MSAPSSNDEVTAWGPLARASSALVALVVTFIMYVVESVEVEGAIVVGFVTSAHAAIWQVVGEVYRLRHRALGKVSGVVLLLGTLAGLGGAGAALGGCGSVEIRRADVTPCLLETARATAELAAAIADGRDPVSIATIAAANLARLSDVCLTWGDELGPSLDAGTFTVE